MSDPDFHLEGFFPYLARNFNAAVSRAISRVYRERYDMQPAEWRCMAILGPGAPLTSRVIAERSSMDKVTVSRAIGRLANRGWITEKQDPSDKRSKQISLSGQGKEAFLDLLPKVRAVETDLLRGLSPQDHATLLRIMAHIQANAEATPKP